jgi:hypothetical protein
MFASALERPWRDTWPLIAQTGDSNTWVTRECWLYCGRRGVAVLWVGSVTTPGATADVYACGPCLATLARMARAQSHGRDGTAGHAARPATGRDDAMTTTDTRTCEHARTVKRGGKTYCRACRRQIYL